MRMGFCISRELRLVLVGEGREMCEAIKLGVGWNADW